MQCFDIVFPILLKEIDVFYKDQRSAGFDKNGVMIDMMIYLSSDAKQGKMKYEH
jgi:hypothetical protein